MKNSDSVTAAFQAQGNILKTVGIILAVLGAILSAVALTDSERYITFSFSYLWGFSFAWTAVLGCLFLVALHHVTHAVWSTVFRRIAEVVASGVWLVALLFVPVIIFTFFNDTFHLYAWMDHHYMEHSKVLKGKLPYLNLPFFVIRSAIFIGLWLLFAHYFVKNSLKQDEAVTNEELAQKNVTSTAKMRNVAGPFMVIFAFTISFAAFDWLMSLDPHWFSTIYGVYIFSGMVLMGFSILTLATAVMQRRGVFPEGYLKKDHIYNLGALLFAFSCFWAYIAFSQFMLIWYANIPEETAWFHKRYYGPWLAVTVLLAMLRFVIPFLVLLPRWAKMNMSVIVTISCVQIVGQMVDLYWLIMPNMSHGHYSETTAHVGEEGVHHSSLHLLDFLLEFGPITLITGLFMILAWRFVSKHKMVPVGDPLLAKSEKFHL